MKILSKQFAALATHFKWDEFQRARVRLTFLYVLIVAVILAIFSGFLYLQVGGQIRALSTSTAQDIFISADRAADIARAMVPEADSVSVEAEVVGGVLLYSVETKVDDVETEVYIDRVTGELVDLGSEDGKTETFEDIFLNDFGENIVLTNFVILLMSGLLSYYLAGRTLRPIAEKMQQQEQFSNDVAHELRTPLAALYASVGSVMRKEETNETYKAALGDVQTETRRLINLTEDLLLTARGEAGTVFVSVRLVAVLEEVVARLQDFANERDVTLTTHFDSTAFVEGDQTMLERAFSNIMHNAITFSPAGSVVTARINKRGQVEIIDTGVGIPEDQQATVFDRFYTTNTARDERGARGTGLGLAIVKEICELHQAKITLSSEEGIGTTFIVTFLQVRFS